MHKIFYASGFLFHPLSEQILLQQINPINEKPLWSLFSKESPSVELCEEYFENIFFKKFAIKIKKKNIHKIYNYFLEEKGNQNIYYANINKLQNFKNIKGVYEWFSQREIVKLNIPKQAKHDIVVGFRVIESSTRKRLGLRTIG